MEITYLERLFSFLSNHINILRNTREIANLTDYGRKFENVSVFQLNACNANLYTHTHTGWAKSRVTVTLLSVSPSQSHFRYKL